MWHGLTHAADTRLGTEHPDTLAARHNHASWTGEAGDAVAARDLFAALVEWVERGHAPTNLQLVEQDAKPPFAVRRSRPLCEWPQVPRFRGGDMNAAGSFACTQ